MPLRLTKQERKILTICAVLLVLGVISVAFFLFGYFVFDRLRDTFAEEV